MIKTCHHSGIDIRLEQNSASDGLVPLVASSLLGLNQAACRAHLGCN
jgi:hypothetical protein